MLRNLETLEFLAGLYLPYARGLVNARGDGMAPVARKGDAAHVVRVPVETAHFLATFDIPQAYGEIQTAGEEVAAVGGERKTMDAMSVPLEAAQFLAALNLPKMDIAVETRCVPTAGSGVTAIGRKGHSVNN